MPESTAPSRREAILQAAIDCIAEDGYNGTSTTAIAKRAGVSRALIHYHYASKEKLAEEAWSFALDRQRRETIQTEATRPGLERVARSFAMHFNRDNPYAVPSRFWLEYWAQASRIEELRQVRVEGTRENEKARVKELLDEIKAGTVTPMNPYFLSKVFSALMLGFEIQLCIENEEASYDRIRRALAYAIDLVSLSQPYAGSSGKGDLSKS